MNPRVLEYLGDPCFMWVRFIHYSSKQVKHRLVTGALLAVAVAVACFFRDLGLVQAERCAIPRRVGRWDRRSVETAFEETA